MEKLPDECWVEIFRHLPLETITSTVSKVCRQWQKASQNPALWRHFRLELSWFSKKELNKTLEMLRAYPPSGKILLIYNEEDTKLAEKILKHLKGYLSKIPAITLSTLISKHLKYITNVRYLSIRKLNRKLVQWKDFRCLKKLERLKIISPSSFVLWENFKFLKHLKLGKVRGKNLKGMLPLSTQLVSLSFDSSYLVPKEIEMLHIFKTLQRLTIIDNKLSPEKLHALSAFSPILYDLRLEESAWASVVTARHFSTFFSNSFPVLKNLEFFKTRINDQVVRMIRENCPVLQYIRIQIRFELNAVLYITQISVNHFVHMSELRVFNCFFNGHKDLLYRRVKKASLCDCSSDTAVCYRMEEKILSEWSEYHIDIWTD